MLLSWAVAFETGKAFVSDVDIVRKLNFAKWYRFGLDALNAAMTEFGAA